MRTEYHGPGRQMTSKAFSQVRPYNAQSSTAPSQSDNHALNTQLRLPGSEEQWSIDRHKNGFADLKPHQRSSAYESTESISPAIEEEFARITADKSDSLPWAQVNNNDYYDLTKTFHSPSNHTALEPSTPFTPNTYQRGEKERKQLELEARRLTDSKSQFLVINPLSAELNSTESLPNNETKLKAIFVRAKKQSEKLKEENLKLRLQKVKLTSSSEAMKMIPLKIELQNRRKNVEKLKKQRDLLLSSTQTENKKGSFFGSKRVSPKKASQQISPKNQGGVVAINSSIEMATRRTPEVDAFKSEKQSNNTQAAYQKFPRGQQDQETGKGFERKFGSPSKKGLPDGLRNKAANDRGNLLHEFKETPTRTKGSHFM